MPPSERLALAPEYADLIEREWARLAAPGTWWDGRERIAIAAEARRAIADQPPATDLVPAGVEAARRVSAAAHTITGEWVAELEAQGLGLLAYVELIGVTARIRAIDAFLLGVGADSRPLPDPTPGTPSRQTVPGARVTSAWIPGVPPIGAGNVLSAVAAEQAALLDVHGVLYLSMEEMGDLQIVKDLTRPQLELVASRTSVLNECFY